MVPQTATLELIISVLLSCSLEEAIYQEVLCVSHESSVHSSRCQPLFSQTPAPPQCSGQGHLDFRVRWDSLLPCPACVQSGSYTLLLDASWGSAVQLRQHWEDGQQCQYSILCNSALQKLPFLHGSPKCGKIVKYGAVSRLFMCELRRKVMSSIGKGEN